MPRPSYDAIFGGRRAARLARRPFRRPASAIAGEAAEGEYRPGPRLLARSRTRLLLKTAAFATLLGVGVILPRLPFLGGGGFGDGRSFFGPAPATDDGPDRLEVSSDWARQLQSPVAPTVSPGDECVVTRSESEDRDEVRKWIFVWEDFCTTVDCAAGDGQPCLKKGYEVYMGAYLFLVFYMFIALAIVCDEFFVPSLECFVEEFGISMDVAGATFMAAGGSMPELFTSFIATMRESDVGFAAIVGSAVFNVLFVIAVCAIASKELLQLTWWPLARDCFFYMIALGSVVLVVRPSETCKKGEVHWYEAIILLLEYVGYCSFMKFNTQAQAAVRSLLRLNKIHPEPMDGVVPKEGGDTTDKSNTHFGKPSAFRTGILQLLTQHGNLSDTVGIAAVTQVKGDLKETFGNIDTDGDGFIDERELATVLQSLGCGTESNGNGNTAALRSACQGIAQTRDGKISFEAFSKWYIASEARIGIEVQRIFDKLDVDSTGSIDFQAIGSLLNALGHKPTKSELNELILDIVDSTEICSVEELEGVQVANSHEKVNAPSGSPGQMPELEGSASGSTASAEVQADRTKISFEQFEQWYKKSLFYDRHHGQHTMEEDEDDGAFSLDLPEAGSGWTQYFWYILTYPICSILYISVPDVRNGRVGSGCRSGWIGNWKFAVVEFCMSLFWIAIMATCLYEWVVVCSNTIGIPAAVSGITILAAGTSVPDLLSSYIVARKGEGDMAVSSSIGSNIFDVTVGLPLPWLAFNIMRGKSVVIQADNLQLSVTILMGMLFCVVVSIIICRWKMSKLLGCTMLALYVIFLVQDLLQQLPTDKPVWDTRQCK